MNRIQSLFQYLRSQGVHVVEEPQCKYAFLKVHDLGRVFELSNPSALFRSIAAKDNALDLIELRHQPAGRPAMYIAEPLFYRFLLQSKHPLAQAFANWVMGTVVKSILKTGQYTSTEDSQNV